MVGAFEKAERDAGSPAHVKSFLGDGDALVFELLHAIFYTVYVEGYMVKSSVLAHRFLRHELEQNTAGIEEYIVLVVFVFEAFNYGQPQLLRIELYGAFDVVGYNGDLDRKSVV